jgi:pimeloyl-ACP methyl ester carboxylesterase
LGRAGFAVVSFDFSDATVGLQLRELGVVLEALRGGTLGVATETYGLIGHDAGAAIALLRSAADDRVRSLVTVVTTAPFGSGDASPDLVRAAQAVRLRRLDLSGPNPVVEQVALASVEWLGRHLS